MPCIDPIPAFKTKAGNVFLYNAQPGAYRMEIPCTKCLGCRQAKAKEWALRCHLELTRHPRGAAFTTLTYSDAHVPVTLSRRHLQLGLKRIRKALGSARPIRFFGCGEYGETSGRPHYHAILYGLTERERDLIEKAWRLGHARTYNVTPGAINYVAGYTAKKYGEPPLAKADRIDYTTGEVYRYQPPFIQMSRRPGIGGHVRKWPHLWKEYAIYNGQRVPVPRFLHEAWKAQATPEQIEALASKKAEYAAQRDCSTARLAAEELIERSKQQLKAARRKL